MTTSTPAPIAAARRGRLEVLARPAAVADLPARAQPLGRDVSHGAPDLPGAEVAGGGPGARCARLTAGMSMEASEPEEVFGRRLDKDHEILLDALGFEPAGVAACGARTGLRAHAVASLLLILEREGRVQQ